MNAGKIDCTRSVPRLSPSSSLGVMWATCISSSIARRYQAAKARIISRKTRKSLTSGEPGHYILSTVARSFQPFRFGTKFTDDRKTECAKEFGNGMAQFGFKRAGFFLR